MKIRSLPSAGRLPLVAALTAAIVGSTSLLYARASFEDAADSRAAITTTSAECVGSYTSSTSDLEIETVNYPTGVWGHWATKAALCSPDERWQAVYQVDGNFVLYDMSRTPGPSLWHTWTYSEAIGRSTSMRLRPDGDLVLLDAGGRVLRSTGTAGIAVPATVTLSNEPTLVITDATGVVRWTSAGGQDVTCRDLAVFVCGDEPS